MSARRRRAFGGWVLAVLLVAAIAAGAAFWLSQSSLLAINNIDVEGNHAVATRDILARVGPLLKGQSLMKPSFSDVERMLLAQSPFIKSVDIDRDFPHTVHLRISEYQPMANLNAAGGKVFIVSAEGRALALAQQPAAGLPVLSTGKPCGASAGSQVSCPDAREGLSFLSDVPVNFNGGFSEVTVADGDISATTGDGVKVHFGSMDDYDLKFEVIRQLITRSTQAGASLTVDVSVPQRPVTRTGDAGAAPTTPGTGETASG